MVINREEITSMFDNTRLMKVYIDGIHKIYEIIPNEGYVLHDKKLDRYTSYDKYGNGIGELILGFYPSSRTEKYDYDFVENPREFYAVLEEKI